MSTLEEIYTIVTRCHKIKTDSDTFTQTIPDSDVYHLC